MSSKNRLLTEKEITEDFNNLFAEASKGLSRRQKKKLLEMIYTLFLWS